jgi:hypothetical protein
MMWRLHIAFTGIFLQATGTEDEAQWAKWSTSAEGFGGSAEGATATRVQRSRLLKSSRKHHVGL